MTATPGQAAHYRMLPVDVEARQFAKPVDIGELARWCGGEWFFSVGDSTQYIVFPESDGHHRADLGDWIVKRLDNGEFYPVKPGDFKAAYEAVAAQEPQPAPLSALGGRSGELTVDEVQELRGKLEASLAQSARQPKPAPDLGTAWRLLDEARAALRELTAAMLALAGEWVADAEHDETRMRPTVIGDARARTLRECAGELRKRATEVTDGTHA